MATLYVRDLPEHTVATLKERAKRHHQSLQAYTRALLEEAAARPTQDDVIDEIRSHATAQLRSADVLEAIDVGRSTGANTCH